MTILVSYGTKNRGRYKFVILAGICYVFVAAFRDLTNTGVNDILGYYENFCQAECSFVEFWNKSPFEKGYTLYVWFMKHTVEYFWIYQLISYGFIFYAHAKFIINTRTKRNNYFAVGALLLGTLSAFYIFRIYLSISMFLLMLSDIKKNRWFRAALWIVAAISFHNSSIILLPVLWFNYVMNKKNTILNRYNLNKKKLIFYVLVTVLIICIFMGFVKSFMSNSDRYDYYGNVGSFATGIDLSAFSVFLFALYRLKSMEKSSPIAKTLIISLSVVFLVIPLQLQYGIMYRMAIFFIPLICMGFCLLYKVYKKSVYYYMIKILSLSYFIHTYISFWTVEIENLGTQYILGMYH